MVVFLRAVEDQCSVQIVRQKGWILPSSAFYVIQAFKAFSELDEEGSLLYWVHIKKALLSPPIQMLM